LFKSEQVNSFLLSSADGGLYLFTPVDPLFLALPYLLEASKASGEIERLGVAWG